MGHLPTPEGLKPYLEKIQAILEMSELEDVTALRQFLGMVTYPGKFMPHLSKMTEPLRRMENNDVEFQWLEQHSKAVSTIKKFLTKAPVLHYYDVSKPDTVQQDASQSGFRAALLQDDQLVCYASHSFRATEMHYMKTEKEMLSNMWSCNKLIRSIPLWAGYSDY